MVGYEKLKQLTKEELQDELNFYQWLIDNDKELGGIEMKHRIWLQSLKIEVKRRGYEIEYRIKLVKDNFKK